VETVTVVGGGLAGTEAAWQLASRGIPVRLIEMRPTVTPPAHQTGLLAELVCSNSFKSEDQDTAAGMLKRELRKLGSILLRAAEESRVPAGAALAVDRDAFARHLTEGVGGHPLVTVDRVQATDIPDGRVVIASGPLTTPTWEQVLSNLVGTDHLAFWDAVAPIVEAQSLDRDIVFAASRYGKGSGSDYLNAPMDRPTYESLVDHLLEAERVVAKKFEHRELFSACQPIEEIARSGRDALRFGPLKPVGLVDPKTGERPWAVVQLRAENTGGLAYNLVGFQTNLTFSEQRRVFRLIPGLAEADFLRFGVLHRNTYIDAPRLLDGTLALRRQSRIRFAGQITGTEGYTEAAATGLLAALNTYADIRGLESAELPPTTALGALVAYATDPSVSDYQPMHANFGLVPPLVPKVRGKRARYAAYSQRGHTDLSDWLGTRPDLMIREVRDRGAD
jgi:methylenetetrahydrofolate--tRNA-(uracil-5-)-methyltransferase